MIFKSFSELPQSAVKDPKASPKLRVYVRSRGKKCRTFQAKDEEEWFEYFNLLKSLCGMKKLSESKEKDGMSKKETYKEAVNREEIQKDSVAQAQANNESKEVVEDLKNGTKKEIDQDIGDKDVNA